MPKKNLSWFRETSGVDPKLTFWSVALMVDRRSQMWRSHQNATVWLLTHMIRRSDESIMTHLMWIVGWIRFFPASNCIDSAVFCFFLRAAILYQGQPLFVSLSLLFLKCRWRSCASSTRWDQFRVICSSFLSSLLLPTGLESRKNQREGGGEREEGTCSSPRWWSSGTYLACFLDHRRQVNCSGGLLPFWLVIFITYTITFKTYYTTKNWTLMLIHLIIILINSLSMLIIIVELIVLNAFIFIARSLYCC
jgi:hypothetical protein